MVKRRSTVWLDAQGRTTAHLLTTSGGGTSTEAAIAAKSNAAVQTSWEGDLVIASSPAGVAADYASVRDYAELLYTTASGSLHRVIIPAPQSGIFMSDGETVDPAQIAGITAAVLANVVTQDGTALTAFVSGVRGHR